MRLTLRTMLAYLDDILEPQDAQGLEQKIKESKFASDLVHRIRSSMRRLRLGAPKVDGKGMAEDANTVAEYLDNSPTMTPDKVLEFEKVCLESDIHLAEVASAHQILTHVLREPALFEPSIRERIYRIPLDAGTAAAPAGTSELRSETAREPVELVPAAAGGRPVAAADDRASLSQTPLALPRPQRSSFPVASLAMTLLLGFVLAVVALRAMGELNSEHPVLRLLVGNRQGKQVVQAPSPPAVTTFPTGQEVNEQPAEKGQATATAVTPAKPVDATVQPATAEPATPEPATIEPTATVTDPSGRPGEEPAKTAPATIDPMPVAATTNNSATESVGSEAITTKQEQTKGTDANRRKPPVDATVGPAQPGKPGVQGDSKSPSPSDPAPMPVNAGIYLSEEQVVAHFDASTNAWSLLPANSLLPAGAELLSLPTYRPQVLVSPNVKVTLVSEAQLKLHAADGMNLPRITLGSGRATLIPVGEMGSSIRVDVGARSGILTFDDIESAAAIFVRLYLPRGADPLTMAPHLVVQLWATSGSIEWQEQGQPAVNITAGQMAFFLDDTATKVAEKSMLPDWIDGKDLTDIDRRASIEMRKFLTPDRPLSLSLMELTSYRQVEVRSLACRTLAHLDIYEPALESFGDEQHRSYWAGHYDALQTRMSQGAEPAARLKSTIDKLFNDQGDLVYRLIRGYSSEQLAAGGAKELVDELTNPVLAIRVLVHENLRRITGRTQQFRPDYPPEQEKSKVLKWRKLLEEGQIDYKEPVANP